MITVEKAKQLVAQHTDKLPVITLGLREAAGCVLAEDIFSTIDLPLFNQSSMDGYAVSTGGKSKNHFEVVGEIKAGDAAVSLKPGQAVRIFTGAAVPDDADAVVMQEKTERINGLVHLFHDYKKGECIRVKGSQIKKGGLALKQECMLNPAAVGFLAALGICSVKVYRKPVVSVIVTGDEIASPGTSLQPGQTYESNSVMIEAGLKQIHIDIKNGVSVKDDKEELFLAIEKYLDDSDVVLISGGISAGKYDFVRGVLKEQNVEELFYKVAQKPGKPLFFGRKDGKIIFALPGNPASALVCFYEYVYPSLRRMQGFKNSTLHAVRLKLLCDLSVYDDRALFIHGKVEKDCVMPLEKQDSGMLASFAEADALICVPAGSQPLSKGTKVEVHLLPLNNQNQPV